VIDDFTGLVHRFDLVLETLRGDLRPKFALSIHVDCLGAARLAPDVTDVATVADIVTGVIDTNHATRGGDVGAGCNSHGDVVAAAGVVVEGAKTNGGVEGAGNIVKERITTNGGVRAAVG